MELVLNVVDSWVVWRLVIDYGFGNMKIICDFDASCLNKMVRKKVCLEWV